MGTSHPTSWRSDRCLFEISDSSDSSDINDTPHSIVKMKPAKNNRRSTSSVSSDAKPVHPGGKKEPRVPLGKLFYAHDDLNSIKCLVAARMTKSFVDSEVAPVRTKARNGVRTFFENADGSSVLTDPFAIAWYLSCYDVTASKIPDKFGALMMQWHTFACSEIQPHLAGLLREGYNKRRDVVAKNNQRKLKLISALDHLNQKLMESRFLFGNKMSLADVSIAVDLLPLMDKTWAPQGSHNVYLKDILSKDYKFLKEWFRLVNSRSIFSKAVAQFKASMVIPSGDAASNCKTAGMVDAAIDGKGNDAGDGNAVAKARGNNRKYRVSSTASQNGVTADRLDLSELQERPLRILCIHGYRQNDLIFKEKLGSFRKLLNKYCEFTFVRAPHPILPMSNEDINQDQRGWWFSRDNDYFKADDASDCDKGFASSLALIEKTFQLHGPFDGLLGFSQGAALISLMCLMKERGELAPAIDFNFAIMVASFKSLSTKHEKWYGADAKKVSMPTLHVFGHGDKVIRKGLSEEMMSLFEEPSKIVHPDGHFVPAKANQKLLYLKFLHKVAQLRSDPEPADKPEQQEIPTASGDSAAATTTEEPKIDLKDKKTKDDSGEVVGAPPVVTDENQNNRDKKPEKINVIPDVVANQSEPAQS